jgi:ABC-type multidrug transport system ATPase subunit/pSer/pThr/pTyr-binding forkhead associated (FHA) protein
MAQRMRLRLRDADGEREVALTSGVRTVGRDASSDIRIPDPLVSRLHGRFERRDDRWYYLDLGSSNGTFRNGERLVSGEAVPLQAGDIFRFGSAAVMVAAEEAPVRPAEDRPLEASRPGAAGTIVMEVAARRSVNRPASQPPRSRPRGDGERDTAVVRVGRAIDNEIVIADPYVSSYHLEAWMENGEIVVEDLNSSNGTYVDRQAITQTTLPPDAVLRLGRDATLPVSDLRARLLSGPQPSVFVQMRRQSEQVLVGRGLGRVVGRRKVILRDVDVSVQRGEFMAIAGASGSGKTTLMKVLNGYTPPDTGTLMTARNAKGEVEIGYVPQEDIIHRDLPLKDALVLSAMLRYPPGTPRAVVEERAREVMVELGLAEHARTMVSRLSGGQRKRVSVALELMTRPRLLLLDEPTSGLDPASDRRLIRLLRALADSGYGILLITHTTANISACDSVAFLAPGGYLVFEGSPESAKSHFETDSLDEVYEKLEEERPEEWRRRFVESRHYQRLQHQVAAGMRELEAEPPAPAAAPPRESDVVKWQFKTLAKRYFRTLLGDQRNLLILLGQVPIIILLARLLFAGDALMWFSPNAPLAAAARTSVQAESLPGNPGPGLNLLFILSASLVWLGTINAARELCKELAIWEREQMVGVRPLPYVLSKFVVLGALAAVQTLMLVVMTMLLWTVPGGRAVGLELFIAGFLAALAGVAVGLAISAAVPTPDRAMALVPLAMIPQIMFGGAIIPLADIGAAGKLISALIATRWSFEALGRLTDRVQYLSPQAVVLPQFKGPWPLPAFALIILAAAFFGLAVLLVTRRSRAPKRVVHAGLTSGTPATGGPATTR